MWEVQERGRRGGREKRRKKRGETIMLAISDMTNLSLEMTGASCTAMLPILSFMPTHVGMPLTWIESLTRMGTPERHPSEPLIPRFRFRARMEGAGTSEYDQAIIRCRRTCKCLSREHSPRKFGLTACLGGSRGPRPAPHLERGCSSRAGVTLQTWSTRARVDVPRENRRLHMLPPRRSTCVRQR